MPALRIHGHAFAILCCFIILTEASQTAPSEVNALIDIKKSLIDPKNNLRNWNSGDPCMANWTGVHCFDRAEADGYFHVQKLYLMTMNLSGSLAPQLGQLSHLQILSFMWNNLTGTIPKEIGNVLPLELLLLSGNKLSGNLPDELGNLWNLDRLQVDENQLSGPIPESFGNMAKVKHLHMNNNSFCCQLPSTLSNLSNLVHLLVDNNNLSGNLPPGFSVLQRLRILQLDNNNFNGNEIPFTYGNFSGLVKLSLRNCNLQGTIPDFSSITNLSYFDLSNNLLEGPIPLSFIYPNLQKLSLENNLLNGSIPASIWQDRAFNTEDKLKINLENNSLVNVLGNLNPPANVTLRLYGNTVCDNSNIENIGQYCGPGGDEEHEVVKDPNNASSVCLIQDCQADNSYELYVPSFPIPCYCAAPLIIGYRLKSPSFSYFAPYFAMFVIYVTDSLSLEHYQLSISAWEDGNRITMYLKLFPSYDSHLNMFNESEVDRIKTTFTSWRFPPNHFFGPYELLSFTLVGPYTATTDSKRGRSNSLILVAAIISAVASIATSALIIFLLFRRRAKYLNRSSRKLKSPSVHIKIDSVKEFTFIELAIATNNFSSSSIIGKGGYGDVHKGILSGETLVAIKRAAEDSLQGQKEFLTEIELLSRLHHRNLVSLIGYCNEEEEQMLVYEFMPNGTLRDWISGKSEKANERQDFGMRLKTALDAAKGVLYLHTEANPPIFHRDIKASNILLDSKFTAKVADFGLSRLASEGSGTKYISTVVKGTPGYLDPEYVSTHMFTDKSDIYSLGVVFLELLTGMQPISRGKHIVTEVNAACRSGMIYSVIERRMGLYPSDCLDKFLTLALRCCEDKPEERPSILDVVRELEDIAAMLSQSDEASFPDVAIDNSGEMATSSSLGSNAAREDQHKYAYVSGSNLVSGVIPTIVPR
ncbi:probable LRR receptor-like serine/threonine-protein kinase At1g06840 isoform X2 [Vigna unguiculata]|uniref:probable LRR receptor-like serine/threonine-protein kinase At1g06840 isoform X2 n=1 Tax=Vigna unguiculata TaxID=3917 RepID=UPI001016076D|nr:probable LRR receptor-like serine/threonine-protein kinase At1g06840 isoform X2 [Vigna unguiculata]